MSPIVAGVAAIVLASLVFSKLRHFSRREHYLPPGPPTTFAIGNATQIPRVFPHAQFMKWAQTYGEIVSLKALNQTIILLSSPAAVKAILDKYGMKTGSRLRTHMAERMDPNYLIMENMDSHLWKKGRKAAHMFLNAEALKTCWPTQRAEFAQFLNDILDSPEDLYTHIKRTTVSVVSTLVYGRRLPKYKDTEAEIFYNGMKLFNEAMDMMAHPPVDVFSPLKYVPERWAPWKTLCNRAKELRDPLYAGLFSECEQRIREGRVSGSYLEKLLQSLDELGMNRDDALATCKMLMDAGAETTSCYLQNFILALVNHPTCQTHAQEEIDRVIGGRLPTFEDLPHLPYVNALIKEVHRFRPVLPLGVPHVASDDVKYGDYIIPSGALIIANLWGICHSPEFFENAEEFRPERYLQSEFGTRPGVNPDGFRDSLPFGCGRRICPGAEMAAKTIAINVMNLLWAFTFSRDKSGTGDIDIDSYQKPGVELAPKPFTCNAIVRDQQRAALIREWHSQTNQCD